MGCRAILFLCILHWPCLDPLESVPFTGFVFNKHNSTRDVYCVHSFIETKCGCIICAQFVHPHFIQHVSTHTEPTTCAGGPAPKALPERAQHMCMGTVSYARGPRTWCKKGPSNRGQGVLKHVQESRSIATCQRGPRHMCMGPFHMQEGLKQSEMQKRTYKSCAKWPKARSRGPNHVQTGPKHVHGAKSMCNGAQSMCILFWFLACMHERYHDDNFKMRPSYSVFGLTFVKMISTSVDVKFFVDQFEIFGHLGELCSVQSGRAMSSPLVRSKRTERFEQILHDLIYSKKNTKHQYIR